MTSEAGVNDEGLPVVRLGEFEEEYALCIMNQRVSHNKVVDPPTDERS